MVLQMLVLLLVVSIVLFLFFSFEWADAEDRKSKNAHKYYLACIINMLVALGCGILLVIAQFTHLL